MNTIIGKRLSVLMSTILAFGACVPAAPASRNQRVYEGCTPGGGTSICLDGTRCREREADSAPVCHPSDANGATDCDVTHVCPEVPGHPERDALCVRNECYIRCDGGETCPSATYCHAVDFRNGSVVQHVCTP